ncbi:hypothetical protein V2J09_016986 [Rumex salicifolius]
MGSRYSFQKGLDYNLSNDSDTVIVTTPENLPNRGSSTSTSNGSARDLNHLGKEIASNDAPIEHQTGVQLAKQEGEDADLIGSCVIDVKCGDGEESVEKICRICHLESEIQEPEVGSKIKMDFIELGCGCKGELGYSHSSCAAIWFHHRGNRQCEICGKTAENVTVTVMDHRFMEQWNETRLNGEESNLSERNARCWQGQPCCNLLLACLVMSFVIPWLLRIDMF